MGEREISHRPTFLGLHTNGNGNGKPSGVARPSVTVDRLDQIINLLKGNVTVQHHRLKLDKSSTFADTDRSVRDYNLIQISTDGSIATVTYKLKNKERNKFGDSLRADHIPQQAGQLDRIAVTNTLAEAGKYIYIDLWDIPATLANTIIMGSIAEVSLKKNIDKGGIGETNKGQDLDWLASDVTPTDPPCMHRLLITVKGANVPVYVYFKDSGRSITGKKILIEKGTALNADAGYIFDLPLLDSNQSYNIRHENNTATVIVMIFEYSNVTG